MTSHAVHQWAPSPSFRDDLNTNSVDSIVEQEGFFGQYEDISAQRIY
jgi:hypothetical protein